MNMNPEQENFDALRRLLKLKRYEQPPPRYFNDFSSQVIIRIKAGGPENAESILERLFTEAPWVRSLFSAFETKPAVAWGFGATVCALVVSGIVYSETTEYQPAYALQPIEDVTTQAKFASPAPDGMAQNSYTPLLPTGTNTLTPAPGSLFDQMQPSTESVSFKLGAEGVGQ
jgi:hypothetical protein